MTSVGVVGAGVAAAGVTHVLDRIPGISVTVLEQSGSVGGRAATRRRGPVTYDYGANYVKADDERVVELLTATLSTEGLVDVGEPVYAFDATGTVTEGRDVDEHKWTYESGIAELPRRLFDGIDARVEVDTRVERIVRTADQWHFVDGEGGRWGPFDALILSPPAPETAALLATADWDAGARTGLEAAARDLPYRSVWTAVLHYPFELNRPYYALVNTDKDHEVGWVAREECKPGHVPGGESVLVVQANHEWSVAHQDDPPQENVAALAELTADLLNDDRLADPDWTDHRGWQHALPDAGVDEGVIAAARHRGLYAVGDWVAGEGRLHAALRNGLETGEAIAADFG